MSLGYAGMCKLLAEDKCFAVYSHPDFITRHSFPSLYRRKPSDRKDGCHTHYIIFDLEWNRPADDFVSVTEPIFLSSEIIEIGAVKLDDGFRPVDELRLLIKPQYYKKLHNRIVALTGINDREMASSGVSFPEAFSHFMTWCGEDFLFLTWSMSDLPILIDNMMIHGIDTARLPRWGDVQRIFSREIMRGETRYSLETALTLLKEQGDPAHDALHDARNTVKVCNHLDLKGYLHEYTTEVFVEHNVAARYETRRDMRMDENLQHIPCPWCGQQITCEPWLPVMDGAYWSYGICPEEDEFLLQFSPMRHGKQGLSARRILLGLSDDLWDIYMDRKEPSTVPS